MLTDDTAQLNADIATFMHDEPGIQYDRNISRALPLAEKIQSLGYRFQLKDMCPKDMANDRWAALFTDEQGVVLRAEHENAATAICRAAHEIIRTPRQ